MELVYMATPFHYVDRELVVYVEDVKRDLSKHCTDDQMFVPNQIDITFVPGGSLGRGVIGVCRRKAFRFTIGIDAGYWYNADFTERYALMAHELTHCYLGQDHVPDVHIHYMNATVADLPRFIVRRQMEEIAIKKCKK